MLWLEFAIMIVMLAAAGVIMLTFQVSAEAAVKGGVMKGGLVAFISILGVSWMGSSFFAGNEREIVGAISDVVSRHSWVFAVGVFASTATALVLSSLFVR